MKSCKRFLDVQCSVQETLSIGSLKLDPFCSMTFWTLTKDLDSVLSRKSVTKLLTRPLIINHFTFIDVEVHVLVYLVLLLKC